MRLDRYRRAMVAGMPVAMMCFVVALFHVAVASAAGNREATSAAALSITGEELKQHVDVLADDSFEGREAGSRGGRAAGGYLVSQFTRYQLRGAGDKGGYYQSFGGGYRNILGILEGRDPELKNQFVLVTAHYDHVGYGNRQNSYGPTGYIHNGADDNASGVAGLLETIDALLHLPEAPRRSVLFALWDGEEKGLLGSKHWLAHPTVPLEQVNVALNVDMIGRLRNRRLEVYGTRTGRGLRRIVSESNGDLQCALEFTWEMKENSDHYPFFARGVPVLMLHTGLHDDYHRPSDDAHRINAAGMQDVARLMFALAYDLAERPDSVSFRPESRRESPFARERFEALLGPRPSRLGIRWRTRAEDSDGAGLLITQVRSGSPAAKAGLQAGDRLLRFHQREISDENQFRLDVLTAPSEVSLVVGHPGAEEPQTKSVQLLGSPVRLGVSWREDSAEPGTVMLTRVVGGSPAQQAGLRPRDRIYAVAGKPFRDSHQLLELVGSLPSPLNLLIERDGRLQTVQVATSPLPAAVAQAVMQTE